MQDRRSRPMGRLNGQHDTQSYRNPPGHGPSRALDNRGDAECSDPSAIRHYAHGKVSLLCVSSGDFGLGLVFEESPGSACDVALEAASDLAVRFALGAPSVAVVAGGLVVVGAGDRDDVEGVVELSVAAAVEAVTVLALTRRRGQRCDAAEASEGGLVAASSGV
jgi:hypothetical protein